MPEQLKEDISDAESYTAEGVQQTDTPAPMPSAPLRNCPGIHEKEKPPAQTVRKR